MNRTEVTRILALAGLVPAGKPAYAIRQKRLCNTWIHNPAAGPVLLLLSVGLAAGADTPGSYGSNPAAATFMRVVTQAVQIGDQRGYSYEFTTVSEPNAGSPKVSVSRMQTCRQNA
jgi:hypothetical protein